MYGNMFANEIRFASAQITIPADSVPTSPLSNYVPTVNKHTIRGVLNKHLGLMTRGLVTCRINECVRVCLGELRYMTFSHHICVVKAPILCKIHVTGVF